MPDATSTQKTINAAIIAESGANIAGMVVSAIAGIKDAKQRGMFSANLQLLDQEQQSTLNKAMLAANSEQERMAILKDVLTDLSKKRIDLLTAQVSGQEKQARTNTYIVAGVFLFVGIALLAVIVKKA